MSFLRMLGRATLDAAASSARDRIDELAFWWLMARRTLPEDLAGELVDRLGSSLGTSRLAAALRPFRQELFERFAEDLGAKVEIASLPAGGL